MARRLVEHNAGIGARYTAKRIPVKLAYYEEFSRIDRAFLREKQIQNWSHAKKKARINGNIPDLELMAKKNFRKRSPGEKADTVVE